MIAPKLNLVILEADLFRVIRWANANGRRWTFSLSNAGARYTEFRSNVAELGELDWGAIRSRDFRRIDVKEHKQAEFLVERQFPYDLFDRIGVLSTTLQVQAVRALTKAKHSPAIEVHPEWYF